MKLTIEAENLILEEREKKISFMKISKIIKDKLDIDITYQGVAYAYDRLKGEEKEADKETYVKKDKQLLEFCKSRNIGVKDIESILNQNILQTHKDINIITGEKYKLKLGIVSDTHLASKLCAIDELKNFYQIAGDEGVEAFVHAGDLVDGYKVYGGHEFELKGLSLQEQADEVIKNYPKYKNLKTYGILGNHDEARLKCAGQDISQLIKPLRDDIEILGFYNAKLILNGIKIELQHGGGSNSYARSYKIQKYLENYTPEESSEIYVLGHYHSSLYMVYRGVHAFLPGAFQKPSLLAKRFNLGNCIGGWIVEIEKDGDNVKCYNKYIDFTK